MKRIIFPCLIFVSLMAMSGEIIFAEEHNEGTGYLKYYNSNGSLDWDTFYAKWDEVPGVYFMYIRYNRYDHDVKPMLWKIVGGLEAILDETRRNDITFVLERTRSHLDLKISPWNYSNAKEGGWIPLGQKRYNYNDAIERWNFMKDNME